MAKYKFLKGELHSNAETLALDTPTWAERVYNVFPKNGESENEDGTKLLVHSVNGDAFLLLDINPESDKLGEKPQCNNAFECPPTTEKKAGE
ncbi:hypothetical protein BG262_02820 [Floricoccus penangensis]|uniref:Uncharacterized protein n=1 Tax=Floricoccus penangensis TaxID=1859475 RepID=A0A9Q5NZT7_9LACT|nr:hypothetical protein [Floricoccus penangensis]OFI46747.1 hypothetical protein BG262_02820 [Floricoccus penangensis]